MKKTITHICLFFAAMLAQYGQASAQNLSNKGTEFWVGYGHHEFMQTNNSQEMVIYLSAEQAATVTVSIYGTAYSQTYNVPANSVISTTTIPKFGASDARLYSGPCGFFPPGTSCGGVGVFVNKGIQIVSDVPIVAYAHIYGSASSGATMLMPVETWGYSYTTINSNQSFNDKCYSWAYAIAQHDDTRIEVTLSQQARNGLPANVPYIINLNKGDIYQVMVGNETSSAKPEMTGSKFVSVANAFGVCYPIAVFAGSSRTNGATSACGTGGGDNDNQQCFPTQAWGKRYLIAPTSSASGASTNMTNGYKIVVKDAATQVYRNGTLIAPNATGFYYFQSNQPEYITSTQPVMIAQFMIGGSCLSGGVGDPEMIYLSPIEQGINRIGFFRNTEENITINYLTLVIPTAGVASLVIDGSSTFSHTYVHPRLAGYTVVVRRWTAAQAQVIASSDSAFTAITYGLGSVESYGYNAGTLINNLNAVGSIRNTSDTSSAVSHPYTCVNTPVAISVLLAYQPTQIVWQLSALSAVLMPSADVTQVAPVSSGSQVINGVPYYQYDLPGTYMFNTADTFRIPLLATHPSIENCNNTEPLYYDLIVNPEPVADFSILHSGCVLDPVAFTGINPTSNGVIVNQWLWTFPDASTDNTPNPIKQINTVGVNTINLSIVSNMGCVSDTSKDISITDIPTSGIAPVPTTICQGTPVSLSSASTSTGALNYYWWDWGDGSTPLVSTVDTAQIHTYATYGTFTVRHVVGAGTTCVSDTTTITITVNAQPNALFTYPAGCLPASGTVQFNSTATSPDGSAITGHLWTFGDPASGAANTSTLPNPTHDYPTFGNYTITYQSTSATGCVKDTTVNATFNLAPTFNYPALAPICVNAGGTVSVATAAVSNGVLGTGTYSGPGTDAAGNFDPAVAGVGTHTIKYIFNTTAGCVDSTAQTILVNPQPAADFTYTPAGCLPADGLATFTYTGSVEAGQTYAWNFGDPASGAANTSAIANPTHNFPEGTFDISVIVVNTNGCRDTVSYNVTYGVTPALAYGVLTPVCESEPGTISVATATVTNGVTGTGIYSGPGTDAAGNFTPTVAGAGTHTITYTFTSTGGCVTTITSTIVVNPKPAADFTYTPAGCLPADGLATFTYSGSVEAGQTYAWNFGDPASGAANTSAIANPTHNFPEGTFDISVIVVNTNGCRDTVSYNVTYGVTPALAYAALTPVCESDPGTISVATATVTNAVTGTGVYSGPGTDAAGNFTPTVAGAGTHTITYTFTSTGGCVTTITSTIVVNPKPAADFTYTPAGCLPADGLATFTYSGSVEAGQTYAWNFGDPASGAANTSAIANPTHNFPEGTFDISVIVVNTNGCRDTVSYNVTYGVTPALAYAALTPVCESDPGTISVATASVTNGVTGTGVYSGPGTDAAGNLTPTVAGAGTHTITYTFTSTGGCVSTITSTIVVNPKPIAAFTATADACVGQAITITDNSTIPTGNIVTWNWDFGDGNTQSNTSGAAFSYRYANYGAYNITLTITSDNGCVSDPVTQSVNIHSNPVAAYTTPSFVCMPGALDFTNTSSNPDNAAMTYSWDFGDGIGTSSAGSPSYTYATSGTYNIELIASTANACADTVTLPYSGFLDKPIAMFSVSPTVLCQGTPNVFTDLSTAPNSTISSWSWDFADGSTSTVSTPSKTYTTPGNYDIVLTVQNAQGCASDPYTVNVNVNVQPIVDAGPSFVVPLGTPVQFIPQVNNTSVLTFLWTPTGDITDPTVLNPLITATQSVQYMLTATGPTACTASDSMYVKILLPVNIPNAFSPNGDGINDTWNLPNLSDYPGASVEVFNRYGQKVFSSKGYTKPWDGNYKGKPLSLATYYYIIYLHNGFKPLNGTITIVK